MSLALHSAEEPKKHGARLRKCDVNLTMNLPAIYCKSSSQGSCHITLPCTCMQGPQELDINLRLEEETV